MDFTKIKENIFVIIIGILFVGALATAVITFINKKNIGDILVNLQSNITDNLQKDVGTNFSKKHTIYSAFEKALSGKKIGNYNFKLSSGVLYIVGASSDDVENENSYLVKKITNNNEHAIKGYDNSLYPVFVPKAHFSTGFLDLTGACNFISGSNAYFLDDDPDSNYKVQELVLKNKNDNKNAYPYEETWKVYELWLYKDKIIIKAVAKIKNKKKFR